MATFEEYTTKKKKKDDITTFEGFTKSVIGEDAYNNYKPPVSQSSEDIAPVKTTTQSKKTEVDDRKWFKKGFFEDGYQFGDLGKTLLSTSQDITENLYAGIVGLGEKIVDAGAYVAGGVGGLFGADEFQSNMQEFIAKDLYDEKKVAKWIVDHSSPTGFVDRYSSVDMYDTDEGSFLGEKSEGVVQSGGQLAATVALQSVGVPWYVTSGVTSFGGEVESAFNQGATYGQAGVSGAITAGAELLTEKLFKGSGLGETGLIDTSKITANITNRIFKTFVDFGVDMASEGAEEIASGWLSALGQKLTYADEKEMSELFSSEDAFESFVGGALLSGGMNAGKTVNSVKTGRDYNTGLTANEQKVVDKEYENRVAEAEKDGKKLTEKEKAEIYEQVQKDLEKGYISTETIESVLGSEQNKAYDNFVKEEALLKQEIAHLEQTEGRTERMENRLQNAKQELAELQQYMTEHKEATKNTIYDMVKADRLGESYNEQARRGQAFEADLTQYDAKQAETIQKAIDSGILNNTNRTHEFVDMVAKISADKGVSFDFTNNQKLKESGFAMNGKTVNGYVTKDGITININSAKGWQSVVGHEISHVLEGTELYAEMQSAVLEYAKAKGEYDSRYKNLESLYKNVEGADINAELTADLVGDYLFTDEKFVTSLSVKHRNVFQKIYDEVKYLLKIATAGSKEARDLERVKRAFDKAYKADTKASGDTKYSLTMVEAVKPTSDKWQTGASTDEVRAAHPTLYAVDEDATTERNPTQVKGTVGSYRKVYDALRSEGFNGTILDASSGLGYGTKAGVEEYGFDVEDIEPYPDSDYKPKYTDYSSLDKKYDVVISNAVLNVLPQDQRDALVAKMGELLNDGGRMFVNVRGKDVLNASGKLAINEANMEYFIPRTAKTGSYQKGFTKPELVAYLQDALGDGYTVEPTNMFGAVSAIVTKDGGVKYSLSDSDGKKLTKAQQDYFKDSKMRDDNGNLKVMYHGSQDAGFHVFDPAHSDDATSLFFVDRNDVAASYSGTSETYAPKAFKNVDDINNFIDEIGAEGNRVVEENGKYVLLYENEKTAESDTLQGIYEEFCDWEGVGYGDANYKVYLNLTNPLEVDAKGRPWNKIDAEFSQEVYDKYNSLTAEEKAALVDLAEWEDFRLFNSEIQEATDGAIASAYAKMGEDCNIYDLFSVAVDNFSDEAMRENARAYLKTRDYAQKAKAEGYDGVIFKNIHDNGGYSNGSEGASTVAIAFDSNQIKSVANESPTGDTDIRYSLSEGDTTQQKINTSMTMAEARRMVDTAFKVNEIAKYYEGEYANAEDWLRKAGADEVEMYIANDYALQEKYINSNEDILNEEYSISDVLNAYLDGTLVGKEKPKPQRLDVSQSTKLKDSRFYSPQKIKNAKATYELANQRAVGESANAVNRARAEILLYAHNKGAAETLGITQAELNKKLRGWSHYSATAKSISERINAGVAEENRWTGIENSAYISRARVTNEDIERLVKAVEGDSRGYERRYIARVMLAADTHIDYSGLTIKFGTSQQVNDQYKSGRVKRVAGFYSDDSRTITVTNDRPHTVAHEMGHFIDAQWGRDLVGSNSSQLYLTSGVNAEFVRARYGEDGVKFLNNFKLFINSLSDVSQNNNEYYNDRAEIFARFFAKFVEWTDNTATGTKQYAWESSSYSDNFTRSQYMEFAKLLQEKALLDGKVQSKMSLSAEGEAPTKHGEFYTPLNELALGNQDIAPTQETVDNSVTEAAPVVDEKVDEVVAETSIMPDDLAPMAEEEANAMQSERLSTITDADAPVETERDYVEMPREPITIDDKALGDIAGEVSDIFGLDAQDRAKMAQTIQNYAQNPNFTENDLFEDIQKNYQYYEAMETDDDTLTQAKRYIRGTKLFVPESLKADFNGKRKDGFNAFRKEHFGHFTLTTNETAHAMGIDQLYSELTEQFPEHFPADVWNPADQLQTIADVMNTEQDVEYRTTTYDDATVQDAVDAILDGIARYSQSETQRYFDEQAADSLAQDADAPPVTDDIAPVAEKYEAIRPKQSKEPSLKRVTDEDIAPTFETKNADQLKGQQTMFDEGSEDGGKTAEVLTEEPETEKKKSRGWSKFKTNFLDKGAVFEDLSLKTKNRELMGKWNHTLSSESRAQWLIGKGADGVKSLNDIRAEVEDKGLTKDFYEYLYHKHNIDRMSLEDKAGAKLDSMQGKFDGLKLEQIRAIAAKEITDKTTEKTAQWVRDAKEYLNALETKNKPVFGDSVTAEVSQEAVNEYEAEHPEFKAWAQDVYDYTNHLRSLMVEKGVISQETADLWAEMYPNYVPIRRAGHEGAAVTVPLDTGRTGVNAPIKRATGGNSDILPLFDTLALRTEQTFKAIARNSFGVELKNTLGTTVESNTAKLDEIIDSVDTHEELLKKGEKGKNPTFTVFENGERVEFEITEDMYDALKPMSDGLKYKNKVLSTATKIQRGLLTEYNPVFMATNAIKDVQDILVNSQHAAKTYANIPSAIKEMVTRGKWYQEYMENGGEQNTYFDSESKTFTKDDTGIKKLIGLPLRGISAANNFIERLPRLAEYIASRKSGASVEVAMLDAARVTTNFAAGGDVTKFIDRNGATFLNASVQGFNQQVRNIREAKANGLKGWVHLAAKFAVAGLPAVLLNHLMWDDDEEYEELSDYVKDNYYVVAKMDDGTFVRIPKGRALAVIQNAMEQISNAATGDDEVDLSRFAELVVNNLAPNNPLDSNILAPIMQVANNETWYGEDLVPTRLQDLPDAEQYDESTDSISKWLGEKLDYSPYKINYLLNQYSGGIGDVFLPMLTPEAESGDNSFGGNIIAPFKDKFTTDSVMNNQNVSDFYDTVDELTKNANSSYATDEDVLMHKYMNAINAELGELYQQKREIQNSNLTDAEKYEAVREIQEQINSLARESLATYGSVNIDGNYATVGDLHYRWHEPSEDSDAEAGWQKITDKQLEKQEEVTSGLGISASEYWSDKDEYDFIYEYPEKYKFLNDNGVTYDDYKNGSEEFKDAWTWASKNPEKYTLSKAVASDLVVYRKYASELYDIKADKDENGKSISGSRKEKVLDYINNLDADYGEKIILFKNEYNADDTYNYEIIDYLNSREDISYEEMATILKELGFTVHSDGRVTW